MSSQYIELLKKTLIDYQNIGKDEYYPIQQLPSSFLLKILKPLDKILRLKDFGIFKIRTIDKAKRIGGFDWPATAKTMVGLHRLNHLDDCLQILFQEKIEGDLVETGVWRGGVILLMAAILAEQNSSNRLIWAFDSFSGLPAPNSSKYPEDKGLKLHKISLLTASLEEVKSNFAALDISTEQVRFVKGWFKDTLPENNVEKIALLRLDGDYYESTILALEYLYPKINTGGFLIIDDYFAFESCRKAVNDYRKRKKITIPIQKIDKEAVYWRIIE